MYGVYTMALTVGMDENGTWKLTEVHEHLCKIKYITFYYK
jgi:hypothetical protein